MQTMYTCNSPLSLARWCRTSKGELERPCPSSILSVESDGYRPSKNVFNISYNLQTSQSTRYSQINTFKYTRSQSCAFYHLVSSHHMVYRTTVSEMTYIVSSGTLNSSIPYHTVYHTMLTTGELTSDIENVSDSHSPLGVVMDAENVKPSVFSAGWYQEGHLITKLCITTPG